MPIAPLPAEGAPFFEWAVDVDAAARIADGLGGHTMYGRQLLTASNAQSQREYLEMDEYTQDMINTTLVAGTNITKTYDDATGKVTLSATATGGTGGLDAEGVQDVIGTSVVAGANVNIAYDDTAGTTTVNVFSEAIQDATAAFIVAGTGITKTYDDTANTLTISASVGMDTEAVQDLIGGSTGVLAGTGMAKSYDDAQGGTTLSINNEYIEDRVNDVIQVGGGLTKVYNDAASPGTITVTGVGSSNNSVFNIVRFATKTEYNNLATKNANTLYLWETE